MFIFVDVQYCTNFTHGELFTAVLLDTILDTCYAVDSRLKQILLVLYHSHKGKQVFYIIKYSF